MPRQYELAIVVTVSVTKAAHIESVQFIQIHLRGMASGGWSPPVSPPSSPSSKTLRRDDSREMTDPTFEIELREMLLHVMQCACSYVDLSVYNRLNLLDLQLYEKYMDIATALGKHANITSN